MFEFLEPEFHGEYGAESGDGVSAKDYSAVLDEDLKGNLPNQFTICSSFRTKNIHWFTDLNSPFTLLYDNFEPWFFFKVNPNPYQNSQWHSYQAYRTGDIYSGHLKGFGPLCFDVWEHECVGIDTETGMVTSVQRGTVLFDQVEEVFVNSSSIKPKNYFWKNSWRAPTL